MNHPHLFQSSLQIEPDYINQARPLPSCGEMSSSSPGTSEKQLHRLDIKGTVLHAWDALQSKTPEIVAEELRQDWYALDRIPFKANDVVIDIGAHVGLVSMYLARRWSFLRIHVFEPHLGNYSLCGIGTHHSGGPKCRIRRVEVPRIFCTGLNRANWYGEGPGRPSYACSSWLCTPSSSRTGTVSIVVSSAITTIMVNSSGGNT